MARTGSARRPTCRRESRGRCRSARCLRGKCPRTGSRPRQAAASARRPGPHKPLPGPVRASTAGPAPPRRGARPTPLRRRSSFPDANPPSTRTGCPQPANAGVPARFRQRSAPPWCGDSRFWLQSALRRADRPSWRARRAPFFRRSPGLRRCRCRVGLAGNTTRRCPDIARPRPSRRESCGSPYRGPGGPQSPTPSCPCRAVESQIPPIRPCFVRSS